MQAQRELQAATQAKQEAEMAEQRRLEVIPSLLLLYLLQPMHAEYGASHRQCLKAQTDTVDRAAWQEGAVYLWHALHATTSL